MTLGEKIKNLIKKSSFQTIGAFHQEILRVFEKQAISIRALSQIINNRSQAREKTLHQIAIILGITLSELRKDTDAETLDHEDTLGVFAYNENAKLQSLESHLSFMPTKLILKKSGQTVWEQDPIDSHQAVKWCAVIMGGVELALMGEFGEERKSFYKGATFSFDSRKKHFFSNIYKGTSVLYIIHSPSQNSDFYIKDQLSL